MRRYMADQVVPAGRVRRKQPVNTAPEIPNSTTEKAGQNSDRLAI